MSQYPNNRVHPQGHSQGHSRPLPTQPTPYRSQQQPQYHPQQQPQYHPQQQVQYQPHPQQPPYHPQQQAQQPYPTPQHVQPGEYQNYRENVHGDAMANIHVRPQPLVRKKTVKLLKLTNGNLIITQPAPERYLTIAAQQGQTNHEEFTSIRYTAATCDPDQFRNERYTLRQQLYERDTELAICMTMYNEDENLFAKTMTAVMDNIVHLCTRTSSKTWGNNAWKKIVVTIVSDGRTKINPRVLAQLGIMGVYQDGIAKNEVNGKNVQAHIYEFTTQLSIQKDGRVKGPQQKMVPVQIIFCLKEKNQKKINSHRWFLNAFCPILNPHVVVLLDVGTKPIGNSIYHLWKTFDVDPTVGGACGEIVAETGFKVLNPIVGAQNFEYKMSNILDKPMESMFGYISVLPGAFSAYRYSALQNHADGTGPLASYFKGESMHSGETDSGLFAANMYLAEDRILCFEIVAKKNAKWILRYIRAAQATTDVPNSVPEFISQRRRWLNGSFFAAAFALAHWGRMFGADHGLRRKIGFFIQVIYNLVNLIFNWFSLATFYLAFYFIGQQLVGATDPFGANSAVGPVIFSVARYIYLFAIILIFVCSMGNRPQGTKGLYILCMIIFAILMVGMLAEAIYTVYSTLNQMIGNGSLTDGKNVVTFSSFGSALIANGPFRDIVISLASTFGIYLLASIIFMDPWHMITSFAQYMIMLPSFVNILMVYAFCNTHDVSWGTKGDSGGAKDLGTAKQAGANNEVEIVEVKADANQVYDRLIYDLRNPVKAPKDTKKVINKDDYYRNFRTNLVLTWMFTNAIAIVVISSDFLKPYLIQTSSNGNITNYYLAAVFWAVAGLSLVRFIGALGYLLGRMLNSW